MYREVTMVEVTEILRLWRAGLPHKRLAAQLGLDPKTVRRYLGAPMAAGVSRNAGAVTEDEVRETLLALQPLGGRPRGDGWAQCEAQRAAIERWLADGLRLTKIHKLLVRQGVALTYPTLYRFAVRELAFGQTATTIPVVDGAPGQEVQLDTGWVGWLSSPAGAASARGSSRRSARGIASSIRPSRKRPRGRSRRAKPRGPSLAASSRS